MRDVSERVRRAVDAEGEGLWELVRDHNPAVLENVVINRNLTEDMAAYLAGRKSATPEVLTILAGDRRFRESYKLKMAVCRNPKTPMRTALSLIKHIRIFDLAGLAKDHNININLRRKIVYLIAERIPSMPLGVKTALSRRAGSDILTHLMHDGNEKVIAACLESPALTEGHIYAIVNSPAVNAAVIRMISEHPKWSLGYAIRYALVRNNHTPMRRVLEFVSAMKSGDLNDLYEDRKLPPSNRPFIYRELMDRGEKAGMRDDQVFELDEEEGHLQDEEFPEGG